MSEDGVIEFCFFFTLISTSLNGTGHTLAPAAEGFQYYGCSVHVGLSGNVVLPKQNGSYMCT